MTERIEIARLTLDGGCQPRATKLLDVIEDYAAAMVGGAEFPPVVVFYDGERHWLADGYHRRDAAVAAGQTEIVADIRQGTRRDAILFSVGANAAHGLRRTNDDKRRSVMTLLNDQEWASWSDGEIARKCQVDRSYVTKLRPARPDTSDSHQYEPRTFVHPKTGAPTTMNTARIGSYVDRPVFDNSRFAEAGPATPEHEPAAPVIDMSKSHLWRGLRDVVQTLGEMPPPDETVDQFPRDLEHALRAEVIAECKEAEFGKRDIEAMRKIAKLRLDDKKATAQEQLEALERVGKAVGFDLFDWAAARS